MTSDAQVAPDWVSLLAPKVRRGVEAAMAQNPAAYADALRRVTGGTAPLDKQTADTVASILIGSTVNSADVDIANAAVALGVHDNGAGLAPQRRIVSLAGKDLAIEALAPKTVRELNLGISSGTNFGQLVSNSLVEVLHTQVSKIFWDEFAKAFVTDGWSQVLWQSMIGEAFRNAANNKVRRALGLAATSGFEDFSTLAPDVTVTGAAKFITPWADNYANTQIENYDVMSARAVQDSLTRYMQQGLSQQAMASRIRASYGLDTKSAFALDAYRDTMLVQRPKQAGIIGKLVLGYADRLLKNRTDMVGQTTAMTALNFGRLLVFTQAQARGDLPPDVQKVWVTAIDERVCPTCRPMDGTSIDMNEAFHVRYHSGSKTYKKAKAVFKEGEVTELLVPPAHPRCRCTIVLSTEFDQGIITRTARRAGNDLSVPEDKVLAKAWTEEEHPRDDKGKWSKKEVAYAAGGAAALLFAGRLASVAYHSNVAIKVSGSTFQELNDNAPALLQHIRHIYPGWRKASISDRLTGNYPAIFSQSLLRKFEGDSLEETLQKITEVAPTLSHEIGFFMDESGKILAGFRGARKGHPQVLMLHPKGLSAEDKSKTITFHTHPTTPRHNQTFSPPSPADMSQMFSERWGPNIIIDGKKNRYEFSWTGDAEGGGLVLRKIHDFELTNRIKLSSEAVKKNMTMDAANQRLMLELHQFYKKLAREVPNFHYRFTAGPIDISKDWKPDLHPRDAIGRFADKLGASSDASYAMLQRHGVGRYYIAHTPSWISHPQTAQDYARSVGAGAGLGIAIAAAVVAPGAIKGSGEFLIHFNDVTAAMEKAGSVFAKAGEYVPAIETNMKSWAEMMKEHIPSEEMRNIGIGIHYKRGLEYAWMDKLAPDPTGKGASSWLDGATGEFVDGSKVRFQAMGKKWLSYLPEDWHQSIKQLYDSGVELDKKTGLTSRERNLDEDAFFTMDQVMNMYHGAVTSNFKRSTTQMFQLAAAKALNLKDAPTWHFAAGPVRRREMMNRARHFNIADRFKTLETAGNLDLGDAIKARYALTQEMLTDMGMDEIHLARGMTITEAQAKKMGLKIIDEIDGPLRDKDATAWQRVTTGLQPINSFTDNPKTAFEYATSVTPKRGNVAVVVRAVFPKDRIFMEGGGGPTGEWMVLGGKTELEAVAFRPGFLDKLTPFDPENPSGFASPDDLNSELGKLWDSNITKIKKWWRRVTRQK